MGNYRAIFDAANDAILIHDLEDGSILDANQGDVGTVRIHQGGSASTGRGSTQRGSSAL